MQKAPPPQSDSPPRLAETNNERFVAFAFASADMLAETDLNGIITFAAGAFRSFAGRPPEALIGQHLNELIASSDQEVVGSALLLLAERGRLHPMTVRMADKDRTRLVLAGITLPRPGLPTRLCLTFGRPPAPAKTVVRVSSPNNLARAAEARLNAGEACDIRLLEIAGPDGVAILESEAIGIALEKMVPAATASQLSPGRFGVIGPDSTAMKNLNDGSILQAVLQMQGMDVAVKTSRVPLAAEGLTGPQAARALRHALSVFTREGTTGLAATGLDRGLDGYLQRAAQKADILRRAIRGTKFNMVFQPIVSLPDRTVHHYEALIRPHPIENLPLANPQEFVMLVEALGLAGELDLAVARQTSQHAARHGVKIAFNLSGQSVQDPAFRTRLVALLKDSLACKAGLLIAEMTETAEIENVEEALATAQALVALDVPFCLDDFGAGTSDMRLLRALNANIVKLDGSYVPGVATAGRDRAFVAGMVEMARAVGAIVVGEKVETEAEAAALYEMGVQLGQGWLFGFPGPLPTATRLNRAIG